MCAIKAPIAASPRYRYQGCGMRTTPRWILDAVSKLQIEKIKSCFTSEREPDTIDPLTYMKFGCSRASATALVRSRVCPGTQFSQVNSQKIRYFGIFSRPKTAALLAVVLPQTFLTFRRRVFSPTLQNLAAATPWKISVKGFPRRVKRTFLKPVFHRWQGRKK